MSEDTTQNLSDRQLLELILTRLAKVEAFVDDRSRDTNPMLGRIHKEIADIGQEVHALRRDVGLLREDIFNERRERADLAIRVTSIEQKQAA